MSNGFVLAYQAALAPYEEAIEWYCLGMITTHRVLTWKLSIVVTEMLRSAVTSDLRKHLFIFVTCKDKFRILHECKKKWTSSHVQQTAEVEYVLQLYIFVVIYVS